MNIKTLRDNSVAKLHERGLEELHKLQMIGFNKASIDASTGAVIPPNTLEQIAVNTCVCNAVILAFRAAAEIVQDEYNTLTGEGQQPADDKDDDKEPVY